MSIQKYLQFTNLSVYFYTESYNRVERSTYDGKETICYT